MPSIIKTIIKAPLNPERLYSKAEDVVLQMKQDKMQGKDLEGFLQGRQVKAEEIRELGIDELFEQETVTRADLLEKINENRIEFEEEVSFGGRASDVEFDVRTMEMEEYFGGRSAFEAEMDYDLEENIKDYYYYEFADQADDTLDETNLNLKKWSQGEIAFDDLPESLQYGLRQNAYENVSTMYYEEPATVVQLYVDGSPVEGYRLVQGPYDDSFTPPADAPPSLRREFGIPISNLIDRERDLSVRSVNEAQVRLQTHAMDQGELELEGDTRWSEYTVDGGKNYREIRYRLAGPRKFREGVHFPDDINNVFHARVTDRVDTDGNNVLFVEELQSDWAQQGRRGGFMNPETLAQGEDQIRYALEINEIPETLKKFREKFSGFENVPSYLANLYDAGSPNIPFREKVGDLSRFSRDYQRRLDDLTKMHYTDRMMELATQDEKLYMARFLTEEANARIGAPGLTSARYRVPDPTTEKGRDDLDVLAEQYIKRSLDGRTVVPEPATLFGRLNRLLPEIREEAKKYANGVMEDALRGFGLPANFYASVEESLESLKPGFASDLRMEAKKPQVAPFVRDSNAWNKLAVKRLISLAEKEGYDKVMFSPSEVQIDRWGEEGLRNQYDVHIPKAIKQVTGSKPGQTTFSSEEGLITGPSIELNQKTPTGETVAERARAGQTMFMVPLAAAGLAGLAAPEMAEASDIPINEGIGKLPRSASEERGLLEEVSDFVRYGPEVGLDAVNAMLLRPIAGSLAGRGAFRLGMTPDDIREAQRRAESFVDYEASPETEAYGQRLLGGIGELLQSETAQKAAPYVTPALKALEEASEGLTSGIIGLNERLYGTDDDERTDALLEVIRPGIEATQPL